MSGFVNGDAVLLVLCHHLRLLFQTSDDSIYGIQEILLDNRCMIVARCNQGCLITDVCYVGTGETRGLAGKEFDI